MQNILIIPGIGNSGPGHWQTRWEESDPLCVRVAFSDWDAPQREQWSAELDAAVRRLGPATVLVAHSLGCLAVAHWAAETKAEVRGALLVAVPDPDGSAFPAAAHGFAPLPLARWHFPSIVVASENDPYASLAFAQRCASAWGSRFVAAGQRGHLNADSGLGAWPEGRALLDQLA